ncbi:ESX-1 secretion-associated protein [Mycobacterium sp. pR1184]|uniref:ESX-1 secretion-associated protein n=1 Tax=Mycobacterium sp. pR1184 TaxID=3238981 RepID=UPI00351BD28D
MTNLSVTSNYLVDVLAAAHQRTTDDFKKSAAAVEGVGVNAWVSHGVACGAGNDAVVEVEARRAEAIRLMIKVADDLATKLRAAAQAYEVTDHKAAQDLDTQLRPG